MRSQNASRTSHNAPTPSKLYSAVICALLLGAGGGNAIAQETDPGTIGDPESWKTEEFNADWGLSAIGAEYAYARGLTGAGVALGHFDSGVDMTHPEFAGRDHVALQLISSGCSLPEGNTVIYNWQSNCHATDGGKPTTTAEWVDPNTGEDFVYYRYGSHGTHVAGTMVAARDGSGMHGVAYGSKLVTARFFGDALYKWVQAPDGSWTNNYISASNSAGTPELVHQFYDQLVENGARAFNFEVWLPIPENGNSIETVRAQYEGEKEHWDAYADRAIENQIITVAALGNDNGRIANIVPGLPHFRPDAAPYWLSVANLQRNDDGSYTINDSSSICAYTMQWCISAPGTNINSSVISEDNIFDGVISGSGTEDDPWVFDPADTPHEQGYADFSGTSMAAPHAIGALGLLFERFPYLTSTQVRDVLLTTATDLGAAGVDEIYGWGMINLRKAIDGPGMLLVDTEVAMNQRAGGTKVWEGDAWDDWRNDISGPGRLTKSGAGWLRLSGDNSFAGAAVNQGILELTGTNTFSGDVDVNAATFLLGGAMTGSNLTLANGANAVVSGSMNNGNIVANGSTVTVSGAMNGGNLTASGGPVVISGSLAGGNVSTSGGPVTISGALTGNLTSSTGAVVVSGSVNQGNIAISNGSLNLSGALDGGSLAFDTGNATIGGTITGGGIDFRNGTLDLSGSVTGGGLNLVDAIATVNGSIDGATTVSSGSTLKGTGNSGDLTVHGTIAPGNSIGTFTVNGNYVQSAGSFYDVELTPPNQSDRLAVSGTATLQGGTVRAVESAGVYILGQSYRILNAAGGITGRFGALDISDFDSPFLRFDLAYAPTAVDLRVLRGAALATAATTENQRATAAALDSLSDDNALLQAMVLLSSADAASTFDLASGEAHASTQSVLVDDSRHLRDIALSRAGNGQDALMSSEDQAPGFGAWAELRGNSGNVDGNDNAAAVDYDGRLTVVGADYQFDNGWRIGALGGVGRMDAGFSGRGNADVSSRFAGLYAGQRWGSFGLQAGLTQAWNDIEVKRSILFSNFEDRTRATYDGTTRQAFIEGGYRFAMDGWSLEPYLQYARIKAESDDFREEGGAAALAGKSDALDVGVTTAGVRFDAGFGSQRWGLRGGLGYRLASGDELGDANLAFVDGSNGFHVQGAPIADKAMIAEIGMAIRTSENTRLDAGYTGQFADESKDHGANLRFSWQF